MSFLQSRYKLLCGLPETYCTCTTNNHCPASVLQITSPLFCFLSPFPPLHCSFPFVPPSKLYILSLSSPSSPQFSPLLSSPLLTSLGSHPREAAPTQTQMAPRSDLSRPVETSAKGHSLKSWPINGSTPNTNSHAFSSDLSSFFFFFFFARDHDVHLYKVCMLLSMHVPACVCVCACAQLREDRQRRGPWVLLIEGPSLRQSSNDLSHL